ncbi:MAG: hypothetical protein NT033_10560 [Candidatus Omnitrophica bacterium]|nr:hypothetical protein [Candidatus Omnitrophota bacterium]
MAGFLFACFNRNKRLFILITYVFLMSYPSYIINTNYAAESGSANYSIDLFTIVNGSGSATSNNVVLDHSVMGDIVATTQMTSVKFGVNTGQVALMQAFMETKLNIISDLRALTSVSGSAIKEVTWQKDNSPYFYWHIDPVQGGLLKGVSVALDNTPDDTIDTDNDFYQFADNAITSGKHIFYVTPVIPSGLYADNMLKFEIWVDTEVPVISNALPVAGSLTSNGKIPISCLLSDPDSGLNLTTTNLSLNGSNVTFSYDQKKQTLQYVPSSAYEEGRNTVLLTIYDNVGNYVTKGWDFLVDTQPPSGSLLINNGEKVTPSGRVYLNLEANDSVSGVRNVYISNDGVFDMELNHPYPYNSIISDWLLSDPGVDGTKTVYVKFDDQAGNLSEVYSASIEVKLLTPDTRIISGPASTTNETGAEFRYEATKLGCKFSYKLDNGEWSVWSTLQSIDFTGLSLGNHYFYVKSALDLNGNGELGPDEEDPTPAQWVWTITSETELGKQKRKTLFWRR